MSGGNVILITVDAWRADFADSYAGVSLLSNWSELAANTCRFTRAYATAPWTSPAIVSLMTGASSLEHGIHHAWSTPAVGTRSLAGIAAEQGYSVPNLSYLNLAENYHNLGYDPASAPAGSEPEILLDAIARTPEPYFLWFHYKNTHLPYWAAPRFRARFGVSDSEVPSTVRETVGSSFVLPRVEHTLDPGHTEIIRALYASSILELDHWLADVIDTLDSRTQLDRTSIFLTSDHGEELMERGHVGHASTAEHALLFEEVLRVPLFVYDVRQSGATFDVAVQGDDIFQAVACALGDDSSDRESPVLAALSAARGRTDYEPLPRSRPLLFHSARGGYRTPREWSNQTISAAIDGRHKVIVERFGAERVLAFDLEGDPGERSPLPSTDAQRRLIRDWIPPRAD